MAQVLGRVTRADDAPRGPDVEFTLRLPASWLEEGACIRFELPRNLNCAACQGGGCDRCGRAGAVSTRGRREPPEEVELTLPKSEGELLQNGLTIRVPERGGLPRGGAELRGYLLLKVKPSEAPDAGLVRVQPQHEQLAEAGLPVWLNGRVRWLAALGVILAMCLILLVISVLS